MAGAQARRCRARVWAGRGGGGARRRRGAAVLSRRDAVCRYIPDAEKPDPAKQALPGAVDNSGCSFEFRYLESRHDVSVLNHTRH